MSKENLSAEEVTALKRLLKRLDKEEVALKLTEHMKPEAKEFLCEDCGFPVHPCIPCSEMVAFFNHVDEEYFRLVQLILKEGRVKKNRTGVDTIGVFGAQAKFDVNMDAFPILTTKKVFFKGIVHELLWFIRGDTNIKYLVDNDVHIWDEWAYKRYTQYWEKNGCAITHEGAKIGMDIGARSHRMFTQAEFINKIKVDGKFAEEFGELGEGTYGGMWRDFPADVKQKNGVHILGVDQIHTVINKLTNNPDDRRMIVSAWHPYWVDHCALPPCHCMFHFNTEELTTRERYDIYVDRGGKSGWTSVPEMNERVVNEANIPKRRVNLLLYQRSCDTFLGVPFNITSYALLLAMVAHCVKMEPGVFTHTYGDLHIYQNHREQIDLQMSRAHRKLPKLWLNPHVKNLFDFKFDDIKLQGYDPHPAIKGEVAV